MSRTTYRRAFTAALAATALFAVGCGDSDDDTTTASDGGSTPAATADAAGSGGRETGIGPLTGQARDEAVAAGEKAGKDAGEPVALPKGKKIGLLQVVGGIESADRLANAIRTASKEVGYEVLYCDGQGVPNKQQTCFDTLLNQGADAILSTGVDPSTVAGQLRKAKQRGVPAITVGSVQPPGGYIANYGPDEGALGKVAAERLMEVLRDAPDKPVDLAVHSFPTPTFADRTAELEKLVKADGAAVKISAEATTDFANVAEGTRKTVTDQLTNNPNLKAFWFAFDTAGQAAGQMIGSRFSGKAFPDRPLVVTFHGDLATNDLVRKGAIDIVGEVAYDIGVWVGFDQLLEFWARDKPMDTADRPTYGDLGDLYDYRVLDKTNLPPSGQYPAPAFDVVSFFQTKWKTEFK
ncbi:MAG: sugar ABC transporter substrate-binding protein [Solirubrobacteraceae bacterium]|nr:sugar ABC transporter substrate-binding protein [Solirubrobacteraceae bacterium]